MMQNKKNWNIFLIIWILLQVFAILVSNCTWEKGMYYPQEFFPFCGYPDYFYPREKTVWKLLIRTYSYSEFFIYTLPAVVGFFIVKSPPIIDADRGLNFEDASLKTADNVQSFSGYNGGHNAGDAVNKAKFNSALNQQGVYQSGDLYKKENNIKNQ